mgnify:FL=1
MVITPAQLIRICPRIPEAEAWSAALSEAMREFAIETPLHAAHFIAQLAHESSEFVVLAENLNYRTPERIKAVWPARFWLPGDAEHACPSSKRDARDFVQSPRSLGNYVYAGRNGNGGEGTGDGWIYRGRGPIQITGRSNYARCGQALGLPLIEQPDLLTDPDVGARAAAWYWTDRQIGPLADANDIEAVTRKINGGTHGLDDRRRYLQTAMRVLA